MLLPWRIKRGPEYAESVENARSAAGAEFDVNLRELERRVRIHPGEATPVTDDEHRVLQLFDVPSGYSLAIYVALDPAKHVCQLEWAETGPIEPDFDPWD